MDLLPYRRCCYFLLAGLVMAGGTTGCRKRKAPPVKVAIEIAPELLENRIGDWAGAVYQSQAKSSIHWQPWSQATLDRAKASNRLVFAVIALPELPGFSTVLADLERDPAIAKSLNEKYVPILIDGDSSREMGLLTVRLCAEIKQPLELPLFMWLSHEGNPVAWVPAAARNEGNIFRLFNQSDEMVSRMWREDAAYVMNNSKADNASRRARMLQKTDQNSPSADPAADSVQSVRQLVSLYDIYSHTIDGAGGLYPTGVLDTLAAAALLPGVPEPLRARCKETVDLMLKDLLPSAMFDPLAGGLFSARAGESWALPNFVWNCRVQSRAAANLFRSYQLTGNPAMLERARALLTFAEGKFQQPDGLFSDTAFAKNDHQQWLWTVEDVEKALPPEDAKWWIAATGMQPLGNLPSESDPKRELFRSNTLALKVPLPEVAASLSVTPEEFARRFEQSRAKLLEIRNARIKSDFTDTTPNAGSSFRMISAYAAAYAATGEEPYREKTVKLFGLAKAKFSDGARLTSYGQTGTPPVTAGRAFIHALAIQAAQDVADITSDSAPLVWAEELGTVLRENFFEEGVLQETPSDARLIKLPVTDTEKIFDDTTLGVLALAEARRLAGDANSDSSLKQLVPPLTKASLETPIFFADVVLATLVKSQSKAVVLGKDLPPDLKNAVERLPLQLFPRRLAKDSDGIPAGSVRVLSPDGGGNLVSTPSALRDELLLPK